MLIGGGHSKKTCLNHISALNIPFGRSNYPLDESIQESSSNFIFNTCNTEPNTIIHTSSHDPGVTVSVQVFDNLITHGGCINDDIIEFYLQLLHNNNPSIKYLKPQFSQMLQGHLREGVKKIYTHWVGDLRPIILTFQVNTKVIPVF